MQSDTPKATSDKSLRMSDGSDTINKEQRKDFASKLRKIWEEYNIQCRNLPTISKQSLDWLKREYKFNWIDFK